MTGSGRARVARISGARLVAPLLAALFLVLLASIALLPHGAAFAASSPTISLQNGSTATEPGGVVTLVGSGFSQSDNTVTADLYGSDVQFTEGSCFVSGGSFSCGIIVPDVSCYALTYGCPLTGLTVTGNTGDSANLFNSSPNGEPDAGIGVYPSSGTVGTPVTLYGDGYIGKISAKTLNLAVSFDSSAYVHFDGQSVVDSEFPWEACVPFSNGELTDNGCSFNIPDVPPGFYPITIDVWINGIYPDHPCLHFSPCTETTYFQVNPPTVTLSPPEVPPSGGAVTVSGNGWIGSDTAVLVSIPGKTGLTSCPLGPTGGFSCSFTVPSGLPAGPNTVQVEGNNGGNLDTAPPTDTGFATLDVQGPYPLHIYPGNAIVGEDVNITGWGYDPSDYLAEMGPGFGGCPLTGGHFTCTMPLPTGLSAGVLTVNAKGNVAGDSDSGTVDVVSNLALNSSTAEVGGTLDAIGTGLAASDTSATLSIDGSPVGPPAGCPVTRGAFPVFLKGPCSFIVPASAGGTYTVTATGNTGDSVSADFQVIPSITVSPVEIPVPPYSPATYVYVTGQGYTPGSPHGLIYPYIGAYNTCFTTPIQPDGDISCYFSVDSQYASPGTQEVSLEEFVTPPGGFTSNTETGSAYLTIVPSVAPDCYSSACVPGFGMPGSQFTLDVVGYSPSDHYLDVSIGSTFIGECPIGGLGPNECGLTVPTLPPGVYTLQATGGSSGLTGMANFTVLGVQTNPGSGPPGSTFNITGYVLPYVDTQPTTFTSSLSVSFYGQSGTEAESCPIAANGAIDCPFTVPDNQFVLGSPGTYQVEGLAVNAACTLVPSDCSYQTSFLVSSPTATSVTCAPGAAEPGSTEITCTATATELFINPTPPTGEAEFAFYYGQIQGQYQSANLLGYPPGSCVMSPVQGSSDQSQCSVSFVPPANAPLGLWTVSSEYFDPSAFSTYQPSVGQTTFYLAAPTSTTVSCSPSTLSPGAESSCSAMVTDTSSSPSVPSGTVSFSVSAPSGTVPPSLGFPSSSASCTLSAVQGSDDQASCSLAPFTPAPGAAGTYTVSGFYPGEGQHGGSQGSAQLQVVDPTSTVVTCSPGGVAAGASSGDTGCTAAVTDAVDPASVPEGTVSWTLGPGSAAGAVAPPTCALSAGSCSATFTPPAGQGAVTLVAAYSPAPSDAIHLASQGSGVFYSVEYSAAGLGSGAAGTVVAVDGTGYAASQLPVTLWYFSGTTSGYLFQTTVPGAQGVRYGLTGAAGCGQSAPDSAFVVTQTCSVQGSYAAQYQVSFLQSGSGVPVSVGYAFSNSTSGSMTAPFSLWVDASPSVGLTYRYPSQLGGGPGVRYDLASVSPGSFSPVAGPGSVVGTYASQYEFTFLQTGSGSPVSVDYGFGGGNATTGSILAGNGIWVDSSTASVTFAYPQDVPGPTGTRFSLTGTDQASPLPVTGPDAVTGNYVTQFLLSVQTSPAGMTPPMAAPPSASGYYDQGTSVKLTAYNVTGFVFMDWLVDGVAQAPLANTTTVVMSAPHSATAVYESPQDAGQSLVNTVNSMGLPQGIQGDLDAKLSAAIAAMARGDANAAVHQLNAFINAVNAQAGKKMTTDQAQSLISEARAVAQALQT